MLNLARLNLTVRFGYNGRLLLIPLDGYTFDAMQIVPFPECLDKILISIAKSL